MDRLLEGKIALITGAGSGIGEGIAHAMANAGARVLAVDMNAESAERTAKAIGGGAKNYACDVTDRAGADALAARVEREVGAIGVLVNNAGIIRRGTLWDRNVRSDWDTTLAVNLDGPFIMTTAFLAQLEETKGSVVNIGSVQSFVALPNSAAYTTSKGGVRALTKGLAIELSPKGIRVNAIGPGLIATPMNAKARENPEYMRNFTHRIPLGRIGTPEDIGLVAVFLASELARYVTGVTLPVDGGFLSY